MSASMRAARAAATVLYREDRARWADPEATRERVRRSAEKGAAPRPARIPWTLRSVARVSEQAVAGRRVVTLTPRQGSRPTTLVYLHGGAYVGEIVGPHWAVVERLIRSSGCTVVVPLYGLAPRHDVDDAIPLLLQVTDALGREPGRRLVLGGDSAGGGLAVAVALEAARIGSPAADRLLLVSPWLDVELAGIEATGLDRLDPMIAAPGLRVAGEAWRGSRGADDPLVSPARASAERLATLPPTRIVQGGREILLPSVRRFARRARAAGADVALRVYPDGFHDFVGATFLPESRDALSWFADALTAS
jgi:epsilon-lactone hydrolase